MRGHGGIPAVTPFDDNGDGDAEGDGGSARGDALRTGVSGGEGVLAENAACRLLLGVGLSLGSASNAAVIGELLASNEFVICLHSLVCAVGSYTARSFGVAATAIASVSCEKRPRCCVCAMSGPSALQ